MLAALNLAGAVVQISDDDTAAKSTSDSRTRRTVQLAVIQVDGTWRIFVDSQRLGRFSDQRDAMQCALDMAGETRLDGVLVEVLSQSPFGEVSSVKRTDIQ